MRDRTARKQEFNELMVERRRQAPRMARKSSLRARMARRLYALAVAAEREETWRVASKRVEAKGGLQDGPLMKCG